MDTQLATQLNDLSAYVTKELHRPERPRILWEVYCGKARTAQLAESMGMETRTFSYETGWNFELLNHQDEFLRLLDEEAPDELLMAPECKLWSRMQSLGRRTPAQQEALRAARQHHHDRHLMFVRRVYLAQVKGGRHVTVEQPKNALSWNTRALRDLPGRRADFSQCRYGAQCLDTDGTWKPVQKHTSLLTTKRSVQDAMSLQCQHDHEHCPLEGAAPGLGSRTRCINLHWLLLLRLPWPSMSLLPSGRLDMLPKMNVKPPALWSSYEARPSRTPFEQSSHPSPQAL